MYEILAFMPHGYCYLWNDAVVWLHVVSDALIALSYFSIPLVIVSVLRARDDIPFDRVAIGFALFILACGSTHLFELWNVWHADYVPAGIVKAITAIASVSTALYLFRSRPALLRLPSPHQLAQLNAGLEQRVAELAAAQEALARTRDQALENSRLKSEFLATMSHEIRTPMNGIIGMTQLLTETKLDPEQKEMASIVRLSAESLLALVNDILDFSKLESGRMHLDQLDFEPHAIIEEVIALLQPRAAAKALSLTLSTPDAPPFTLHGDPARVRQVVLNLVGNALRFTDHGNVIVRTRWVGSQANLARFRVEVADTGIGIPAAVQRHLFEPFVQGDGSSTRRHSGTGLGLAISRQLVEAMGGDIGFDSREGQGSTFWFELPRLTAGPRVHAPRVLLVDDDPLDATIAVSQFQRLGLSLDVAPTSAEALIQLRAAALAGQPFSLALLDWRLPGRDGLELAAEIRSDPPIAGTPLVVLSGVREPPHAPSEALRLEGWFEKPLSTSDLARCRVIAERSSPPRETPVHPRRLPHPLSVLVVEDNEVNQFVLRRMLDKLACPHHVVDHGAAALDYLAKHSPDVVLMDCQMPVLDGFATTRRIRAGAGVLNPAVRIIALTAYAMPGDRARCLESGMDDYLAKPVSFRELEAALIRASNPRPSAPQP